MRNRFLLSIIALWNAYAAVDALDFAYEFPATTEGELVHGLCVMDGTATSVSATSSYAGLTYNLVQNFADGMPLWPTDTTSALHQRLVGEGGFCNGGTYIQPNLHHRIPRGTVISVQGSSQSCNMQLCYFVESDRILGYTDRDGGWGQLPGFDLVSDYQWDATRETDKFWPGIEHGTSKYYCKTFESSNCSGQPSRNPSAMDEGIKLVSLDGSTEYPSGAVTIVSWDTSTVTVDLNQAWGNTVNKYFSEYKSNSFNPKCFEEDELQPGVVIDRITIQCFVTQPFAILRLCLQDTTGYLLDPVDDQGTVEKCCHSDAPLDTPTVCYNLEIACQGNTQRRLLRVSA